MKQQFGQFVRFGIVGFVNTIVSYGIYYLIVLISPSWYILGNILGFICGVFISFILNRQYVFNSNESKAHIVIFKTYISYLISLLVGTGFLAFQVEKLKVSEFIAPIITLFATVPLNFILNKFWVYRRDTSNEKN